MLAPLRERFPDLEIVAAAVPRQRSPTTSPTPRTSSPTTSVRCGRAPRRRSRSTCPSAVGELAPNLRWVQAIGAGIDHLARRRPARRRDHHQRRRRRRGAHRRVRHRPAAVRCGSGSPELDEQQRDDDVEAEVRAHRRGADARGHRARRHRHRGRGPRPRVRHDRHRHPSQLQEGQDAPRGRRAARHRRPARRARPLRRGRRQRAGDRRDREHVRRGRVRGDEAGRAVLQRRTRLAGRRGRVDRRAGVGPPRRARSSTSPARSRCPADDPLWSAPNIYISPHCSAAQDRYTDKLLALFADNLDRYTRGEELRNVVDRAAGY